MDSFCDAVLLWFLKIGSKVFHHVSQAQTSSTGGDIGIAIFVGD